ncbi:MAG: hypothetical protein HZB56_22765 [Deltaproteobacteria bacterium]|nr:hypothetical protein [Deltaproteobacteria bacterium]
MPLLIGLVASMLALTLLFRLVRLSTLAAVVSPIAYLTVWRKVFPQRIGGGRSTLQVPQRVARLRTTDGATLPVRFVGELVSGEATPGDDLSLLGASHGGTLYVTGGMNHTSGARILFSRNPWKVAFPALLLALLTGGLLLLRASQLR